MSLMKYFTFMIIVQLFYSFSVSLLAYSFANFKTQEGTAIVQSFQSEEIKNMTSISERLETTTKSSLQIPVVDLAALVFYSGNIFVDLIMNFLFAVPSMVSLLVGAIGHFAGLDPYLLGNLKTFFYSFISILYFIAVLQFLLSIRARTPGAI